VSPSELRPQTVLGIGPARVSPAQPVQGMPSQMEAMPELQGLSLRSNFAWALAGNVVYAACQWGIIIVLAKLANSFVVGQFSLGLAVATPVLMFSNFDLRAVQATDARRQYRFAEYFRLRVVMTLVGLLVIAGIVRFGRFESQTAAVILAVALAKGVETLSDIHYGLFQLNDRLDQTGKSMMLRGVLSVIALAAALHLTHKVVWGCVWLALAWLGALVMFDVRRGRRLVAYTERSGEPPSRPRFERQWKLLHLALPLGIVTTIASINVPVIRGWQDRGVSHAAVAVVGGRQRHRLVWISSRLGSRLLAPDAVLQPGVCRPHTCVCSADRGGGDSLCRIHADQRDHVGTLFPNSGADVCPGGGIDCSGLRAIRTYHGLDRRSLGGDWGSLDTSSVGCGRHRAPGS